MGLPIEGRRARLQIARMIWLSLRHSRPPGAIASGREIAAKWQYKVELLQMVWAAHREDPMYPLRWLRVRQLYREGSSIAHLRWAFHDAGFPPFVIPLVDVND